MKIGEFSRIAQVSARLLRYYDQIDLLKPDQIDDWTEYRYYTVEQLPRLNRILALKELGLSLEQIRLLLDKEVSTEEIRRLYLEHKAQLEESLRTELERLRQVELRIDQLTRQDDAWMPDVVIKALRPMPILSYRNQAMTIDQLLTCFAALSEWVAAQGRNRDKYGPLFTILYSDEFTPEAEMDMEIGVQLNGSRRRPLTLTGDITLTPSELPAVAQMATIVHRGVDDHPIAYNALGRWLEAQHYQIVGPSREVALGDFDPIRPETCIMEIQFPVARLDESEWLAQMAERM